MQKIKNNAFTLLELIIVVVILGILASIAIPLYTNAVEQRRGGVCINNMRTIFAAWRIYNMKEATDYDPDWHFVNITTINSNPPIGLGTAVDERYFGHSNYISGYGFSMKYNPTVTPPYYYLITYRQSGPHQCGSISCYYYPNGHDVGGGVIIHYDWGTGTGASYWPWIPADE